MDSIFYKAITSLVLIIFLLYFSIKLVQKYSSKFIKTTFGKSKNLKLIEIFYIDSTNKVVSLKHYNTRYLILLNRNNNLLLNKYEDK